MYFHRITVGACSKYSREGRILSKSTFWAAEIFSQLNLTEDQKKQLEANKKEHRAKMENAHQEMKIDKEALKNELMKPYLDMPRVKALHKQIKTLLSQMEDCKLNSILAVRGILSPEQFSKFVVLMQKHSQE